MFIHGKPDARRQSGLYRISTLSSNGFLLPFLDIDFFHFFGVISPRILCLFPMKTDFLGFFSICKIWCLQDQAWIRWSKLVNGVPCAKQLISLKSELSNAQCTKIFAYEDRRVSLLCQNRDAREGQDFSLNFPITGYFEGNQFPKHNFQLVDIHTYDALKTSSPNKIFKILTFTLMML